MPESAEELPPDPAEDDQNPSELVELGSSALDTDDEPPRRRGREPDDCPLDGIERYSPAMLDRFADGAFHDAMDVRQAAMERAYWASVKKQDEDSANRL